MSEKAVAGVDWAGGEWLAVILDNSREPDCEVAGTFQSLWERIPDINLLLVDVPIGLPDDEETLSFRKNLDAMARSVTGRPRSVFPVPSRAACQMAYEGASYEKVASKNECEINKGINPPSYQIASGIGEIDAFVRTEESRAEKIIESHPELCFRGLLGRRLEHSKKTAAGVGERLAALENHVDVPPENLLGTLCRGLVEKSRGVDVDDVVDALGLAITAWKQDEEPHYLPIDYNRDSEKIPIRMAYWSENPLD